MKKYRFRDVPKKKRLSYFMTYYGWWTFFGILFLGTIVYGAYEIFLRPGADVSILWLGSKYDLLEENVTRSDMEQLDWDMNQDGTTRVDMQYIEFSAPYDSLDADTQMEVMLQTSAVGYYIYIVDEDAYEWLSENNMLCTWAQSGLTGGETNDFVKIAASSIGFFQRENRESFQNTYICISVPPEEDDGQALEAYRLQVQAFARLVG